MENIRMHSNVNHRQHEVSKGDKSLIDLLAVLLIGGVGMTISLFGLEANDPLAYILGIGVMAVIFSYGLVRLITAIRNFIWENQGRARNKEK